MIELNGMKSRDHFSLCSDLSDFNVSLSIFGHNCSDFSDLNLNAFLVRFEVFLYEFLIVSLSYRIDHFYCYSSNFKRFCYCFIYFEKFILLMRLILQFFIFIYLFFICNSYIRYCLDIVYSRNRHIFENYGMGIG